jgi:trigger factor
MSNYNVKTLLDEALKKEMEISFLSQEINKEIDKKVNEYQKTYKLDGFRVGKVPVNLIREKHENGLLAEVSEDLANNVIQDILKEKKYKLALNPKVDFKTVEINKNLVFTAVFELLPNIPKIEFKKIALEKEIVELNDKDMEEAVTKLVENRKDWKEEKNKDYKAKKGDLVEIDFLGKIKNVPFEGGEAKNYRLELGTGSFIQGFEDQLIGKKVGDDVLVKVKFPKEYHKKELIGQPAEFEVKIHKILLGEKPELTNEFLKKNFNVENMDKLKEVIKKETETMYKNITQENMKNDLFEWIKKNIKVKMPEGLVEEQFKRIWESAEEEIRRNPDKFKSEKEKEKAKKENRELAEDMVKIGLVLSEIGKENDIKVSNQDITNAIYSNARQFPGQEDMFIDYYKKNKNALNDITGALLEEKVIAFIFGQANVKETKISTKEFTKRQEKRVKKK